MKRSLRSLKEDEIRDCLESLSPTQSELEDDCASLESAGEDFVPKDNSKSSESKDLSEPEIREELTGVIESDNSKATKTRQRTAAAISRSSNTNASSVSGGGEQHSLLESTSSDVSLRTPTSSKRRKSTSDQAEVTIRSCVYGRDGTEWKRILPGNTATQNVLRETPGPTSYAKRCVESGSPASAWRLFVNERMLRIIQECTQAEARSVLAADSWTVSLDEIDAFIAILYARGAYGSSKIELDELWSQNWGAPIFFSECISRDTFREIMGFIRFDRKATRAERRVSNKFCLVSDVWSIFVENCLACYRPSENITIDEQVFPSKCRCPFTQYMSHKPDKFGIKFWVAADGEKRYILNAIPYLGKDESRPPGRSLGEHVVLRLIEPFEGKGRNITVDNFFTSKKLGDELLRRKTSLVGTMNRARREIPLALKNPRDPLYSSKIFQNDKTILTSYQGKVNKNVMILSTLHQSVEIDTESKKKKYVLKLRFYNATKAGVGAVDQMARIYTVRAATRRWTLQVLYNILDFAAINAHTVYKDVTKLKISRRNFLLSLAKELSSHNAARMREAKENATKELPVPRKECQIRGCNNRTKDKWQKCRKNVCGKCTSKIERICFICTQQQ